MRAQDDQLARLGEGVDRIRGLGQNMQEETKTQLVRSLSQDCLCFLSRAARGEGGGGSL